MNTKITFPELINAISVATNTTKRVSETFLKEFFAVITESLIKGDNVKIKRIGTFKLTLVDARKSINVNTGEEIEIPAHNRLVFIPDKELADAVNMPFSSFETIELSDVISDSDLAKFNDTVATELAISNREEEQMKLVSTTKVEEEAQTEVVAETRIEVAETEIEKVAIIQEEPGLISEYEITEEAKESMDAPQDIIEEPENKITIEEKEEIIDNTEEKKIEIIEESIDEEDTRELYCSRKKFNVELKCSFGKGFFWGFVCSLFTSFGIFFVVAQLNGFPLIINESNQSIDSISNTTKKSTSILEVKDSATLIKKIEQPIVKEEIIQTKIQVDTITKKKYLTTLARKYYGDYNFWVYIYEENNKVLGDPNKIKPGTVVVIPDAAKYGIDKTNKNSLNDARKRALVIFKKYE